MTQQLTSEIVGQTINLFIIIKRQNIENISKTLFILTERRPRPKYSDRHA